MLAVEKNVEIKKFGKNKFSFKQSENQSFRIFNSEKFWKTPSVPYDTELKSVLLCELRSANILKIRKVSYLIYL